MESEVNHREEIVRFTGVKGSSTGRRTEVDVESGLNESGHDGDGVDGVFREVPVKDGNIRVNQFECNKISSRIRARTYRKIQLGMYRAR